METAKNCLRVGGSPALRNTSEEHIANRRMRPILSNRVIADVQQLQVKVFLMVSLTPFETNAGTKPKIRSEQAPSISLLGLYLPSP
jgi:hypothetical protein